MDQLTQLAKDAHVITSLDDLRKTLGPWRFFQNYGAELFMKLRSIHYAADETKPLASERAISETQEFTQGNQNSDIRAPVAASLSSKQISLFHNIPVSQNLVIQAHRPLGVVSGNIPGIDTKRLDIAKTVHGELPDSVLTRELPASSFGRLRKASRKYMDQ